MLVLSRKPGDQILIGDDIVITVVRLGPNTVKIGIDAPKDVGILRPELKRAEGLEPSAQGQTGDSQQEGGK